MSNGLILCYLSVFSKMISVWPWEHVDFHFEHPIHNGPTIFTLLKCWMGISPFNQVAMLYGSGDLSGIMPLIIHGQHHLFHMLNMWIVVAKATTNGTCTRGYIDDWLPELSIWSRLSLAYGRPNHVVAYNPIRPRESLIETIMVR